MPENQEYSCIFNSVHDGKRSKYQWEKGLGRKEKKSYIYVRKKLYRPSIVGTEVEIREKIFFSHDCEKKLRNMMRFLVFFSSWKMSKQLF